MEPLMPSAFKDFALVAHGTFPQSVNIKIFNPWSNSNLWRHGLGSAMLRSQKGVCQQRETIATLQIPLQWVFLLSFNCLKILIRISQLKQELEDHRVI